MGSSQRWQSILICGVGLLLGFVVGVIVAANIAIFAGPDQGYESDFGELFSHNTFTGIAVVLALVSGPVMGLVVARQLARRVL